MILPLDVDKLRAQFAGAHPFPFVTIEPFLEPAAAAEVAQAYPTFAGALEMGFVFKAVNEQKKVQVTDARRFPSAVAKLNEAIAAPRFLADLEAITGIPKLLADEQLAGGGMHVTGPGGRLDVHIDFNVVEDRKLYRRLNLLLYLNPVWKDDWGGFIELWDRDVKQCHQRYAPMLNRCVIFETSNVSYHGVSPITCPPDVERKSFAAYYYTAEPPASFAGVSHSTIFRARPDERLRGLVLMPAERLGRELARRVRGVGRKAKRILLGP